MVCQLEYQSHKIYSGSFDLYDPQFQARGNGYVIINGNDTATLNGSAPRMYVYVPTLQQKWDNVEITIYSKRLSRPKLVLKESQPVPILEVMMMSSNPMSVPKALDFQILPIMED